MAATILLAAFASYAIIRNWDRRLFRWSFFYLLGAMFIPFPVVALPQIQLTGRFGLDNPLGVILLATMFQLSFSVLLFTAFLRSIPVELEESARIDGASTRQTFWRIVFPLLAPTTFFLLVVNTVYAFFDTFGIIHAVTRGGPAQATNILVYKVYSDGFIGLDLGGSAAQSVVLMVIVVSLTVVQFRYQRNWVHYD